jgi:hypothetical protein
MNTITLKSTLLMLSLAIASSSALAKDTPESNEDKLVSGMSIVGNDEAPKSLVIVPWKSSDLGETLNVSKRMDDGRGPVDREVFVRALDYYEIRRGAAK